MSGRRPRREAEAAQARHSPKNPPTDSAHPLSRGDDLRRAGGSGGSHLRRPAADGCSWDADGRQLPAGEQPGSAQDRRAALGGLRPAHLQRAAGRRDHRRHPWGDTSGFPTTTGVYVPNSGGAATGGIYIVGDSSVTMSVDASGNQKFDIVQGSTTTHITVDLAFGQIRKQVGSGSVTTYTGTGSGVMCSTGNITSLSGTVADNRLSADNTTVLSRSAYTIATDVNNGKNITVPSPIRYQSAPDPTLPTTDLANMRPGTLGLYSRNVIVGSGAPTNMEIDAVIMAGGSSTTDGSFYVSNWNTKTPTGTLKVTGSIIQKARGPVGTFSGAGITSGYAKNYWYDPRMADNPPPYFPTTGGYDRISWRKLAG